MSVSSIRSVSSVSVQAVNKISFQKKKLKTKMQLVIGKKTRIYRKWMSAEFWIEI